MVLIPPSLLSAINDRENELIEICRNMIKNKSFTGQEKSLADYLEKVMRGLNYDDVQRDHVGNVIGIIEGDGKGPTLMFNGHMDTVSEGELSNWRYDPYKAEVHGDVIYGRGASDMKGALASMALAGALLKEFIQVKGRLLVACVVHEEDFEGFGARHVIKNFGRPAYIILGEATDLQMAIGHRGRVEIEIEALGRTSHGSTPEEGLNAIELMLPLMEKIRKGRRRLPSHPFLGKASVSINGIRCSPDETAIIPDRCMIVLDRRIIPGETKQSILGEYYHYIENLKSVNHSRSYRVDIASKELICYTGYKERVEYFFPPWLLDHNHGLVHFATEALESALNRKINLTRWLFSTDGAYTAGTLGIPTIGFGPGEERYAHTPSDQVKISNLINATKGYCSLAFNLFSRRKK
ncbi:YgeY family selenium metabolism-linked hydrolase [[Eubacterium] cellulosolvens]